MEHKSETYKVPESGVRPQDRLGGNALAKLPHIHAVKSYLMFSMNTVLLTSTQPAESRLPDQTLHYGPAIPGQRR